METYTYQIITYDVWGSGDTFDGEGNLVEEGGYEVNAAYFSGDEIEIPEDATDYDILVALQKEGWLEDFVEDRIKIDGELEYSLYIEDAEDGYPLLELRNKKILDI